MVSFTGPLSGQFVTTIGSGTLYHALNANRSKQSEPEINGSALSFLKVNEEILNIFFRELLDSGRWQRRHEVHLSLYIRGSNS